MITHDVPRGIGYFGTVAVQPVLAIDGWMLSTAEAPLDSFVLVIDGERVATSDARRSPETVLPDIFPPGVATFFTFQESGRTVGQFARIEVVGCVKDVPVARIVTPYRADLAAVVAPPEHLMLRVTGNGNADLVKAAGLRCAGEFLDTIARHRPLDSLRRVLDWGCGCARVTVHLIDELATRPWIRIDGADIDPEAVQWAKTHVRGGEFTAIQPYPPLPWPDSTFDAVVACSVFTHLTREVQRQWLAGMMRVIAPGGLLLASITTRGAGEGFVDVGVDERLNGIAPKGYYRGVAQSRAHTYEEWSEWFDVTEFIAGGLESSQDLVVLRRRGSGGGTVQALVTPAPRAPHPAPFPNGHFYSPVPSIAEVVRDEERIFRAEPPLRGIDLRHDEQLALFHELKRYYAELPYEKNVTNRRLRYTFDNPNYGYSDAIVLYSMIRHLKPKRIVEVGSGYSSCVMLDTNELFFDKRIECTFIDPHAELVKSLFRWWEKRRKSIVAKRVQDVPESTFTALEANDILFIDSTHVLKAGSDVNYLLFEILPLLQRGVYVHIHDVFYPFEYPRSWIVDLGLAWNEAYAVRAFLQYNAQFEIAFFNTYLEQLHPELFHQEMPLCMENPGGSLWLRRV